MGTPRLLSALSFALLASALPGALAAQSFVGDFSVSSGAVYQTADTDNALGVAVDTITAGGPFVFVTGESGNAGATVKLSSAGVALTSAAFTATGTGYGHGVAVDQGGNVWVAGHVVTTATVTNWVVQKYDSNLVLLASTTVAGFSLGDAVATSIALDGAGNAFVAGYSSNPASGGDFRVMKYSPSLAVLSSATPAGADLEQARGIALDSSGNAFVTGGRTTGSYDYLTMKFTSSLVFVASTVYNGGAGSDDAYGVAVDPSGNAYVTGFTDSGGANYAFTTLKYDSSLNLSAFASYNTGSYDSGFAIVFTGTNTVVAVGASQAGATEDMVILEYDAGLVLVSSRAYDTGTSDRANAVAKGTGTYVYITGHSYTDPFGGFRTIRLNASAAGTGGGSAPAPPSALAGSALSTSMIFWSWSDNSTDETGFRVMSGTISLSGDLAAGATSWLQTGLSSGALSGPLTVQAFNGFGATNSPAASRYAWASAPTGLAAGAPSGSSVTLTWSGDGSSYEVERSTGAGFVLVASTAATSHGDTGLSVATTYYYRVRALNGDAFTTAYGSSVTVVTLPAATGPLAPTSFTGTPASESAVLWSWTDNSAAETGYRVLSGTISLSGDLAANTTVWLQSGLSTNTAYGPYAAEAFNSTGTAPSATATRYSGAAAPSALSSSTVFQTSATLSWTGNNPAATLYELERSTGTVFALVYSSSSASYLDAALASASTYYYRVRALNGDGVAGAYASSITVVTAPTPSPGAPTGFAGTGQSSSSILWTWSDNAANEDGYRVLSGTVNLSGDLTAGATLWLQNALSVNASYGPYSVQAFNAGGTANSATASRYTLAAVPGTPAAFGVYQTSATLSWSGNGNPGTTVYRLERSTGTGYGLQFSGTATTYFDGYLTPGATHFYRVLALNGDAVASAYSATATVVAVAPPPLPGIAGTPVGTALGTSSATWTWVLAAGATNHALYRASDNSYLGGSSTGPFVQAALTPNTAYGLRAAGVNVGGTGPLSPSGTVYTLAAVPAATAVSSITATAQILSWSLNGNPAGTVAQLSRSSDAVTYASLTSAAVTSYADADLLGCTTYYYRVRHLNGDSLPTSYASWQSVTANTDPAPPAGLTATANAGGTVSLSWNLSPTEGVNGYRLFWDAGTGTVNYAAALAVLGSTATAYTSGVLTSSASYTFALRAAHRCGVVGSTGALATSGAATAAAAVRAAIKAPASGKRIAGNSVTILGELTSGLPESVQQIVFQYKLAASTAWVNIPAAYLNNANPDYSFPYFTHWDVTVMATGSYDLRAVVYDRDGVPDAAPPTVQVMIDPVNPDSTEGLVAGKAQKSQTVANTVTNVVETAGVGASDPAVRVMIPAGTVNSATTTVTVIANPAITTAAPSGQQLVGSAVKINLASGQTALNGTAQITLTYPSSVIFPSLLQIYYLDEATGRWSRDFTSTVNTSSRTVTGLTPHFSTFALLLGTAFAPNLDDVRVYPVPFKPNGVNADEGRPFSSGDANSGIIFANLAMGSEIKIYTLTGRQVATLDTAPITGTVRWDARNQDGRDVASGAYFAVIKAEGQKTVVKKLVIIR